MAGILRIDPAARGIVASGYSSEAVGEPHTRFGFDAAVNKPFTLHLLAETLDKVLTRIEPERLS